MKNLFLSTVLTLGSFFAFAQESFTDDELATYATVMLWAETEKAALSSTVSDSVAIWLEDSELSNSKYNELSKAEKKGELESVEVTEVELAEYQRVKDRIDSKTSNFKETYVSKIKDDIGAGLYNRLKKALKSNEDVKIKYKAVYENLETGEEMEIESTVEIDG